MKTAQQFVSHAKDWRELLTMSACRYIRLSNDDGIIDKEIAVLDSSGGEVAQALAEQLAAINGAVLACTGSDGPGSTCEVRVEQVGRVVPTGNAANHFPHDFSNGVLKLSVLVKARAPAGKKVRLAT